VIAALCGVVLWLAAPLPVAWADGDPASDVLVATPPVFIPPASGISYAQETEVAAQLRAAARAGHPLRVAVIPDRIALGSIGALWKSPERYAVFLDQELSLNYHGELLVVMPNGFGVSRAGAPVRTALAGLAPRTGQLVIATEQAIMRLTGARVGDVRAMVLSGPSRTAGVGWWAATAAAAAAIVGAWWASVRIRPVGVRRTVR
jgi:hypothetical protein